MIQSVANLHEIGIFNAIRSEFWSKWFDEPTSYIRHENWASEVDRVPIFNELGDGVRGQSGHYTMMWSGVVGNGLGLVVHDIPHSWNAFAFGDDRGAIDSWFESLKSKAPEINNDDESVIPIAFWSLDGNGSPTSNIRKIGAHRWADIRDNYPIGVRTRLDDLMAVDQPSGSGKLVLWHGPPGTGKTNCIRALAHAWRGWCDVDYIVDPEHLFGRAHYMMNCLVNGRNSQDRWRLVVIEDSGEFLRKDAKAMEGQSFGRLLNLTDGLVGQGLKLIILVTTNEPFGDLHPAVARPGRCLAHLEFGLFSPDEASHWLRERVATEMSLADLYEHRAEHQTQITEQAEGYRPGLYV